MKKKLYILHMEMKLTFKKIFIVIYNTSDININIENEYKNYHEFNR
jgi:hypothetical protein